MERKMLLASGALLLGFAFETPLWADEAQAIRTLDASWTKAAGQKDAPATAAYYAENGVLLPPNSPIVKGRAKIQEVWASFMGKPGFMLHFDPTQIVVSRSKDLAYDIGTYELTINDDHGQPMHEVGKYLVTWKKDKGSWKVMADMFSADK
jgi:uncharacterized protein (TIGR02246 family)